MDKTPLEMAEAYADGNVVKQTAWEDGFIAGSQHQLKTQVEKEDYLDHEKHVNTWFNYRNKIRELTDVELSLLAEEYTGADGLDVVDYGRAIMQAYREKLNDTPPNADA